MSFTNSHNGPSCLFWNSQVGSLLPKKLSPPNSAQLAPTHLGAGDYYWHQIVTNQQICLTALQRNQRKEGRLDALHGWYWGSSSLHQIRNKFPSLCKNCRTLANWIHIDNVFSSECLGNFTLVFKQSNDNINEKVDHNGRGQIPLDTDF